MSTKRAVIYGLCSDLITSTDVFQEAGLDVVAWFSNVPQATHPLGLFTYCKFAKEKFYGFPQEAHDFVMSRIWTYLDMASRIDVYYELDVHDFINILNKTFDYYYHLLTSEAVDLIIFSSMPHVGDDWLLYMTAQYLGIKTIVLYQSLFPNHFFYTFDIQDFGYFNQALKIRPYELISIEKKHEKEIFYMQNVKRPTYGLKDFTGHFRAKKLLSFLPCYKRFRTYEKKFNRYACMSVDWDAKYVYFPLHLQPEMTTSTLGGRYADQMLALEKLSQLLPKDWFIYLKENPIQTEFMRGRYFWDRLSLLPNIKFVPINTNTHALIQHSQFVSTITGTAGWEAITGGKNALVFGQPWYITLPGVFQYRDDFVLADLLAYEIDHGELEASFSRLSVKMVTGLVSEDYRPIVPNFDPIQNERNLVDFLKAVL
jgi:hypothetical protein